MERVLRLANCREALRLVGVFGEKRPVVNIAPSVCADESKAGGEDARCRCGFTGSGGLSRPLIVDLAGSGDLYSPLSLKSGTVSMFFFASKKDRTDSVVAGAMEIGASVFGCPLLPACAGGLSSPLVVDLAGSLVAGAMEIGAAVFGGPLLSACGERAGVSRVIGTILPSLPKRNARLKACRLLCGLSTDG